MEQLNRERDALRELKENFHLNGGMGLNGGDEGGMLETPLQEAKTGAKKQGGLDLHEQELMMNEIDVVCQRTVDSFLDT